MKYSHLSTHTHTHTHKEKKKKEKKWFTVPNNAWEQERDQLRQWGEKAQHN